MTNSDESPTYGVWLAVAGWDDALSAILAGVVHDLNGRITSLDAIAQLLELGETPEGGYAGETKRLHAVSSDVQLLIGDLGEGRRPVLPGELLERALRLYSHVKERPGGSLACEVPDPTTVPPVLVQDPAVLRALVTLFHTMDGKGGVRALTLSGDEDEARVVVSGPTPTEGAAAEALTALLEAEGASLSVADDGAEVRFPSLSRARAAGR